MAGGQLLWYGKNQLGNEMSCYAMSKMDTITSSTYHAFSVQNTKNGNYSLARNALDQMLVLEPDDGSRYYGWLLLYYYRDYEKALEVLEMHDALTPNFSDEPMGENINYLKGLAKMQLDSLEPALVEFNFYIDEVGLEHGEDWVNIDAYINKGTVLAKLNRHAEAVETYKKAIKHFESSTEGYYYLGLSQMRLGELEEAMKSLNVAKGLIDQNRKQSDGYVELFHEVYKQDISNAIVAVNDQMGLLEPNAAN